MTCANFSAPKCCCDGGGEDPCDICSDAFNRSDSSDISTGSDCGWDEEAGDPTIASNVLRFTTASAIAVSTTQQPDGDPDVFLTVLARASASGDKARLIGAYVDASNYHYCEVIFGTGTVTIGKRTAGTDSTLVTESISAPINTWLSMNLCLTPTNISSSTGGGVLSAATTASSPEFGLGTGGTVTGNVEFDDFTAAKSGVSCFACFGRCQDCLDFQAPLQLKLVVPSGTFSSLGGCTLAECQALEGTFFLQGGTCTWSLCLDDLGGGCCPASGVRVSFLAGFIWVDFGNVVGDGLCGCCVSGCDGHSFRLAYVGAPDCMNWLDLEIPFFGSGSSTRCTSSSGKSVFISAA